MGAVPHGDRDDKKDQTDTVLVKVEAPKNSIPISSASSIQELPLKTETKEEDTIHDSDFEEPSGLVFFSATLYLFIISSFTF